MAYCHGKPQIQNLCPPPTNTNNKMPFLGLWGNVLQNYVKIILIVIEKQWHSQGHYFGGGQVASGEGILGGPPPNFYTNLDFWNGLEHNWGGAVAPPLTTPLLRNENMFRKFLETTGIIHAHGIAFIRYKKISDMKKIIVCLSCFTYLFGT